MGTEFSGFGTGNSFFNPIVFNNTNKPTTDVTFVGKFVDIEPGGGQSFFVFDIDIPAQYVNYTIVGMNGFLINAPISEDVVNWNNNFQLDGNVITGVSTYSVAFYVSGGSIGLQMYFYLTMANI
jgi:hypothetical protein